MRTARLSRTKLMSRAILRCMSQAASTPLSAPGKRAHDLVADGLDDAAAVLLGK